jgi:recombinational DNA repair protein (RecF pathway)
LALATALGIDPDMGHCAHCGAEPQKDEALSFSVLNNALYCPACTGICGAKGGFQMNSSCRVWLLAALSLSPAQLGRITLDTKSLKEAKVLTQAILTTAIGRRLKTPI